MPKIITLNCEECRAEFSGMPSKMRGRKFCKQDCSVQHEARKRGRVPKKWTRDANGNPVAVERKAGA